MTKLQKINKIIDKWQNCERCELYNHRNNIVFYRGNVDARIVIIEEAPGKNEDLEGKPFVGQAGELFDKLLKKVGVKKKNIFICNTVSCRPPNNRKPTIDEYLECRDRLYAMVSIVDPKAILLLGATALSFLVGSNNSITKERGKILSAKIPWKNRVRTYYAIPTFHPAYLLRNRKPEIENMVVSDIRKTFEIAQDGSYIEGN